LSAKDIRWVQRLHDFSKALTQLAEAVDLAGQRKLSRLERLGIIQVFKFSHELAWNTLKYFLENRGAQSIYGSKDATREAFKAGLIENGETWMDMIKSRNQTTHTYDEAIVAEIVNAITDAYFKEFTALQTRMNKLKEENLS